MYEYSRARAGHYAKVLLQEPEFLAAIEVARWQAYPLGLAMVAEMVEKLLHSHIADDRRAGVDALKDLVEGKFVDALRTVAAELYGPFPYDLRGEQAPGSRSW